MYSARRFVFNAKLTYKMSNWERTDLSQCMNSHKWNLVIGTPTNGQICLLATEFLLTGIIPIEQPL